MPPPYNLEGRSFYMEEQDEEKDVEEQDVEDELTSHIVPVSGMVYVTSP